MDDEKEKNSNLIKENKLLNESETNKLKEELLNEYIDILEKKVGKNHKYQYLVLFLGFFLFSLVFIILYGIVLFDDFPTIIYSEKGIVNEIKVNKEFCKKIINKDVTIIEIKGDSKYSWAVEFDFYCSEISNAMLNASLFTGLIFAMIFLPIFNNFLGRLKTILITIVCGILSSFLILFAVDVVMLFIGIFLFNLFVMISGHTSLMYTIEMADNSKRSIFVTIVQLGSTFSMLIYDVTAYYSNSWRAAFYLFYILSALVIIYVVVFINESPKTFISQKNYEKYMMSLLSISITNKTVESFLKFLIFNEEKLFIDLYENNCEYKKLISEEFYSLMKSFEKMDPNEDDNNNNKYEENDDIDQMRKSILNSKIESLKIDFKVLRKFFNYEIRISYNENKLSSKNIDDDNKSFISKSKLRYSLKKKNNINIDSNNKNSYSAWFLLKYKSQRVKFLLLEAIVFLGAGVYFGHTVNIKNLPGNIFVNALINTGVELIGNIISNYVMNSNFFKRVNSIKFYYFFSFMLYLILIIFSLSNTVSNIISFCIKAALVGSINIFFVLCSESYPNTVRNFGYGLNIGTGKVGALILSFVSELISTFAINILFSVACLIIFLCTFFIEETYGKTLPTEIPELLEEDDKIE